MPAQAVTPVAEQPSLSRQGQLDTSASSHRQHAQNLQSTSAATYRQPAQHVQSTSAAVHTQPAQNQLSNGAAKHRQPPQHLQGNTAAMHRQHAQDLHKTSSGIQRQHAQDQLNTSAAMHRQPAQNQLGTTATTRQESAQNPLSITQSPPPVQLASTSFHSHQRQGHSVPFKSSAQSAGDAKDLQSSAIAGSQGQQLTLQIKQMKKRMIEYASLLDDPRWKQQQPDGGKTVSENFACSLLLHAFVNNMLFQAGPAQCKYLETQQHALPYYLLLTGWWKHDDDF